MLWRTVMVATGDCGAVLRRPPSDLYTVTTNMMSAPGKQTLIACHVTPLPLPPIGCGGVEVRGVDALRLPGTRRYFNGTVQTARFHLVGRWDGSALILNEPPQSAQQESGAPSHEPIHSAAEATR